MNAPNEVLTCSEYTHNWSDRLGGGWKKGSGGPHDSLNSSSDEVLWHVGDWVDKHIECLCVVIQFNLRYRSVVVDGEKKRRMKGRRGVGVVM